jgi:transposase
VADGAVAGVKKKARSQKAWIFFPDESGISQHPSVRRTWAPQGETPVLIHAFHPSKVSVSTALGYRWDGQRTRLFFRTHPGSYNAESLVAFREDLHPTLGDQKVVLVWDGLPAHRSHVMRAYRATPSGWLRVEPLPGYAPDLNPVEMLWGNIKGQELAHRCAQDLEEAVAALRSGMARVRRRRKLAFSFLQHAGLSF